jgi:hypothetical protein
MAAQRRHCGATAASDNLHVFRAQALRFTKEESMTRFGLSIVFAALGVGLAACGSGGGGGSGSKNLVDLVPVDNTVSGWTVTDKAPPITASTKEEGMLLIDGGIEGFYKDGYAPKMVLWQNYENSTLSDAPVDQYNPKGATISLYVLEMPSEDKASGLFANLRKYSEYNPRTEWKEPTDPPVGAGSRIQDTNQAWWINFYKGVYYAEISFSPSTGPAPEYKPGNENLKKEAIRFAQAVASKL